MHDLQTAESELSRRNAVLDALTCAATRIISGADWRLALPELLARLGVATNASRAFLFEMHSAPAEQGIVQSCRYLWSAPSIEPIDQGRLQNMPIPQGADSPLAELLARRHRGEVIQITRSRTSGDARLLLEEFATYSLLSVPILVEGAYWGSLGFDDCLAERIWDETEVDLLKTATALIAGGIERSRSDERLRERDNLLVGAQRIAQMGSWVLDFQTNQVTWSEEGLRIFGLDSGTAIWTHDSNLQRIHPADRAHVAEMDAKARNRGEPFDIEYRILRPSGEIRVLRERADVMRDGEGRASRLVGIVHDITDMKRNETRLKESEERYALAARGAGVGLWDWNVATDHAYFSHRLHELLAVGMNGLGPTIAGLFDRFLPQDREALMDYLDERFSKQRHRFELEVRSRVAENDVRWFLIRGLIVYAEGKPARLVGSLSDITDQKRAFEEIARQRESLYQKEKMAMLGSLLAGVAHELNNPLSVVIGQVALLEQTASDPAVLLRVPRIQKATERCARIVRTFLAMARHRDRQSAPVKINGIVDTVIELLAFQLRSADIQIERDLAFDIPEMMADADQLHQLLTNLIVNARQALALSPQPRVIRVMTRFDFRNDQLQISVRDNGPGIPPEIRKRIFEPFFTTKPAGEGTGIGLSLCSSIVRAHGGTICVADSPGGGATFTVELPLKVVDALSTLPRVAAHGNPSGSRVLIIEDELEIAETLSEIIRSQGHDTCLANDGSTGLDFALSQYFDVILSDIRLPNLDGLEIYRVLQRKRPNLVGRLAFITGDTLSAEIQSFLTETGALCLEKPFLPADVIGLISRLAPQRVLPA
jgi:two-component system NtrC family sensor kinase